MRKILIFLIIYFFTFNIFASSIELTKEEKEYLKNKKVLTVANLETFPPFNFNENGIPMGYTVDYLDLVSKYLGIKIEYISNKPWNEYLTLLKEKKLDLIPHLAVNNERKEYIDFTDFNHIEYTTGMAINKNSDIKSMNDLKDKIIAVANNTFLHTYLKNNFPNYSLLLTSSTAKAVEAVYLGHAHAVIGSLPALDYYIQKNWLSNVKTVSISGFGSPTQTALPMGVLKGNTILKSIIEKANVSISHREVLSLKKKWMNISPSDISSNSLTSEEIDYLVNKNEIKICVDPDWLPFEQIDKNGKYIGIGADIMKIISKYIERPIVLVPTKNWTESLDYIKNRKCDILPAAMNIPNRRDSMNFTGSYLIEPFVIATKLDELFVKDSSSLSGKKIGIVKDYAFLDILKQKNPLIEIIDVKNTKEGLEKVSNGELFGYIDTMPTIGYGIQEYSMYDLKIAGKLEFNINLSIASRNDEGILNTIMQKALDSIIEEEKRTIIGKWIEIKVSQEFDYTLLWQITIFFIIIVLAILYKNRAVILLNRELIQAKQEIEEQQKMVDKYVLILSTDTEGIITEVNEAFCKATGYSKLELLNKKYTILRKYDENDNTFMEIKKVIYSNKTWFGEIRNIKKDKEDIWFNMYIEPIIKNGIKIGYRTISENITDKKRIEELSVTDKLTGLSNRLKLDEIMITRVAQYKRHNMPFSIILIDIDDFKKVNDTFGHDVGDYVLKEIAKILKEYSRITDTVGRWGGEEFVVICENTNLEQAKILAENLRKIISSKNFEKVGTKTISLGIAEFQETDSVNSIFKRADKSLYNAKTSGKNKIGEV
uniref:diguanylate cyclase n=1 Tax=Aliarcobacter sp. TaxID=2321116 RepID=UPI004048D985